MRQHPAIGLRAGLCRTARAALASALLARALIVPAMIVLAAVTSALASPPVAAPPIAAPTVEASPVAESLVAAAAAGVGVAQSPPAGRTAQPADAAQRTNKDTAIRTEVVTLGVGASSFKAYLARPAGDAVSPGLVLVHEWWGLNDWVRQQADRFARDGYVALAPDLYHGEVARDAEHAHELMRGLTEERAAGDLKTTFDYLAGQSYVKPQRIGAIGWCMGGGFALRLAIAEPRLTCTVVCYGRPVTDVDQLKKIKGPLLGIWGATDRGIDVSAFEQALKAAGVTATHHVYPGAGHAFLNETNKRGYNKEQAEKAWGEIDGFLGKGLKAG